MTSNGRNPFQLLESSHRIALVTHLHPDGDAYGSLLGLKHLLSGWISQVDMFGEMDSLSKFAFLPGYSEIKTGREPSSREYDYCFVLDCGNTERMGAFQWLLDSSREVFNIDHHVSNTRFGDRQWIDPTVSSTSELITRLAGESGLSVSPEAATCLLSGIIMDTGGFLYENTSPETHRTAAALMDQGADHHQIRYQLFQNRPLENVLFLGYLITHMELFQDQRAVLLTVSDEMLKNHQVAYEDLDEFIAYVRDIAGVELAVILKEISQDEVKVSFRSKKWLDVNKLAATLGGGGHERAAGAVVAGSLQEARELLEEKIAHCFSGGSTQ